MQKELSQGDLGIIQYLESKTYDALAALEANADILRALRSFYNELLENEQFPCRNSCKADIRLFSVRLERLIDRNLAGARRLVQNASYMRNFVCEI
jgi:hypothetical protein